MASNVAVGLVLSRRQRLSGLIATALTAYSCPQDEEAANIKSFRHVLRL